MSKALTAALIGAGLALAPCALARDARIDQGRLIAVGGGPGGVAAACMTCHGIDGRGDFATATPRLFGLDAHYLSKQLDDYALALRSGDAMIPIARALSPAQRAAVALYYEALTPFTGPAPQPAIDQPMQLQQGAILWARGSLDRRVEACAGCHARASRRAQGVVDPSLAGQPAAYIALQLRLWRDGRRRNDKDDVMRAIALSLSEQEIDAVAAYAARLAP